MIEVICGYFNGWYKHLFKEETSMKEFLETLRPNETRPTHLVFNYYYDVEYIRSILWTPSLFFIRDGEITGYSAYYCKYIQRMLPKMPIIEHT